VKRHRASNIGCRARFETIPSRPSSQALGEHKRALGRQGGDLVREKLQEMLNPEPNLHEQAANDPAVQATKQAYEAAYAKALAKAGGKI
jgi:hypothetical protein